jgi:putative FmdB family regulatory protein
MPTYEYECTSCGTVFELFQPITEPPRRRLKKTDPKPCDCDAPVTRRVSAGGGLIFKGSGFYQTDYRSESYKKAAKADAESTSSKGDPKKDGASKKPSGDGGKGTDKKSNSVES